MEKSIRVCPDLLVREEKKAIAYGQGDVTFSYFQPCLLGKCIAYNAGGCQKYGQSVKEEENGNT